MITDPFYAAQRSRCADWARLIRLVISLKLQVFCCMTGQPRSALHMYMVSVDTWYPVAGVAVINFQKKKSS